MAVMGGAMRGCAIVLVAVGCGAVAPTNAAPDAAYERPVLATGADAVSDQQPTNRPMACGGAVVATGIGLGGAFSASYVHVQRCDGDCASMTITVADGPALASQSFTFVVRGGATGTYLGSQTVDVLARRTGEPAWTTLSATVDLAVAEPPGLPTSLHAPPFGMVVGTFTILAGGVDLSGSFSSPVRSSTLAV